MRLGWNREAVAQPKVPPSCSGALRKSPRCRTKGLEVRRGSFGAQNEAWESSAKLGNRPRSLGIVREAWESSTFRIVAIADASAAIWGGWATNGKACFWLPKAPRRLPKASRTVPKPLRCSSYLRGAFRRRRALFICFPPDSAGAIGAFRQDALLPNRAERIVVSLRPCRYGPVAPRFAPRPGARFNAPGLREVFVVFCRGDGIAWLFRRAQRSSSVHPYAASRTWLRIRGRAPLGDQRTGGQTEFLQQTPCGGNRSRRRGSFPPSATPCYPNSGHR